MKPQTKRLGCIDGLRGYLALGVYLTHFVITYNFRMTGAWERPSPRSFGNCGDVAVSLFFMITGFLFIGRLLQAQAEGRALNWGRFYTARVFRLFPLYAACVAVIFAIVFAVGGTELRETPFTLFKRTAQWMLFLDPDINGFQRTSLIVGGVTWTLRYEWAFYLALPFMAWMARRQAKAVPTPLTLLAALALYFYWRSVTIPGIALFTPYFILFAAGGLAARAYRIESLNRLARRPAASWIAAAALLTALLGFEDTLDALPLLLLTLFFVPVALGNSLGGLLNRPISILLGNISYSIYLLHGIVLYLAFSVLAPHALPSMSLPFALGLWMPTIGMVVILASWLTHRFIEQPGVALGQRIGNWLAARASRERAA